MVSAIPAEADDAAEKVSYMWESDVPIEQIRTAILEAAAPHIARAAVIAELRKLAHDFDETVEEWEQQRPVCSEDGLIGLEGEIRGVEFAADHIRSYIEEMEAQR